MDNGSKSHLFSRCALFSVALGRKSREGKLHGCSNYRAEMPHGERQNGHPRRKNAILEGSSDDSNGQRLSALRRTSAAGPEIQGHNSGNEQDDEIKTAQDVD